MSFTTLSFLGFVIIIAISFYMCPKRGRILLLSVASMLSYLSCVPQGFIYILFSILLSYGVGMWLGHSDKNRRVILFFGIVINIGLLILTKYFNYLIELMSGKENNYITKSVDFIVPLGISFYTLSIIGYLIDVYRRDISPEKKLVKFSLFVSYFPHILQGPIARYGQLSTQFEEDVYFDYRKVKRGLQLMAWGYFKKLVIADKSAIFVNTVFAEPEKCGGTVILIAALLYTVQIYADFSGCVDIARGTSELFGITLADNFKQPYFSKSIGEFWRRWHISLSSWFRDYLYIPLGGNRKGNVRKWINVLIVFCVSGVWHGVGVKYLVWGGIHSFYQIMGAALRSVKNKLCKILKINMETQWYSCIQIVVTLVLVTIAWIFFRAEDVMQATYMIGKVFLGQEIGMILNNGLFAFGLTVEEFVVLVVAILLLVVVDYNNNKGVCIRDVIEKQNIVIRWSIYYIMLFAIIVFGTYGIGYNSSDFIYMQF